MSSLSKWFSFTGVSLFALVASGCGVASIPGYRRVATDSPEFRAAVAREIEVERAAGQSPTDAESAAIRRVRAQMIGAEKQRRNEGVTPLLAALEAMERPRGCWAYTVATTRNDGGKTSLVVERFDPFLPEERVWTLVSREGRAPSDEEQSSYRRVRLSKWKKELARASDRKSATERTRRLAMLAEQVTVEPGASGAATHFHFTGTPQRIPYVGAVPEVREVYGIADASHRLVSHARSHLGPMSALGGSVVFDRWEQATSYETVDPDVAPFPRIARANYRMRAFGIDSGEVSIERVYSDYRRVKCYDDRFDVLIGVPSVQDLIPEAR